MSATGGMPTTRSWLPARLGLGLLLVAAVAWSAHFLFGVFDRYRHVDPATYTFFWDRRAWLWTHLAGGGLTLVLGPLQFLTQWPRAHARLHRWSGRLYLIGMLIACTGATGLIATSPAPFGIRLAFAATAWAWLLTALAGLVAIRRGQVRRHRTWMTRSYLVTLAPVIFRVFLHLPGIFSVLPPPPEGIAWLLWLSWLLPLVVHAAVRQAWQVFARWRGSLAGPVTDRGAGAPG